MSKELPSNKNTNEEVDLIVFFNYIGDVIGRIMSYVASIFKVIFSVLIHSIKVFINSWKIIVSVVVIAAILGYISEQARPVSYQSEMLVKPYFDSKYQLVNNISFFNALIANKDYGQLNRIFNSDSTPKVDVEKIKGFSISPGPETENDRILQYQKFTEKLDSITLLEADYDKFIENRSIYSGEIFLITAKSNKKDIFSNLAYGINSAFTNEYSNSKKVKDTLLYKIQRENIEKSLEEVEKLQDIYIQALQEQAKNPGQPVSAGEFLLTKEKELDTKEYALLDKELALRDQLRRLDEKRITEDVFVDIISSFQPVGNQKIKWKHRYSIIYPILSFLILCFFFLAKKTIIYAKNYED